MRLCIPTTMGAGRQICFSKPHFMQSTVDREIPVSRVRVSDRVNRRLHLVPSYVPHLIDLIRGE